MIGVNQGGKLRNSFSPSSWGPIVAKFIIFSTQKRFVALNCQNTNGNIQWPIKNWSKNTNLRQIWWFKAYFGEFSKKKCFCHLWNIFPSYVFLTHISWSGKVQISPPMQRISWFAPKKFWVTRDAVQCSGFVVKILHQMNTDWLHTASLVTQNFFGANHEIRYMGGDIWTFPD